MMQNRTHTCGELRLSDAGKQVKISGWMENVRVVSANLAFVVVRDFYGTTQVVAETEDMVNTFKAITKESTISVEGVVRERDSKTGKMATGDIEIVPAKVEVLVASASGSREILSSHKVHITADALAEEVDYSDVDLVVLPGGIPGTPNLAANKTVTDTCVAFAKAGKKVAAICAAPSVLAALGLLEGKNATAHAAFQDKLAGAHVLDTEVVVDGNITTSYGLGGAIPFALELVRQLAGEAEADRIRNAIAYRH